MCEFLQKLFELKLLLTDSQTRSPSSPTRLWKFHRKSRFVLRLCFECIFGTVFLLAVVLVSEERTCQANRMWRFKLKFELFSVAVVDNRRWM